MAEDTTKTESADEQVDVAKNIDDQLSCSVALFFWGASVVGGSFIIINLLT